MLLCPPSPVHMLFFGAEPALETPCSVSPRNKALSLSTILMVLSCPEILSRLLRFCKHMEKATFNCRCIQLNSSKDQWTLELGQALCWVQGTQECERPEEPKASGN